MVVVSIVHICIGCILHTIACIRADGAEKGNSLVGKYQFSFSFFLLLWEEVLVGGNFGVFLLIQCL